MDGLPPPESVGVQVDDTEVEAGGAEARRLAEGQDEKGAGYSMGLGREGMDTDEDVDEEC